MNHKNINLRKKIWSMLLVLVLLAGTIRTWAFGAYAELATSDRMVVFVSVEDTAARIEGTNPVVSEARGVMLPLKAVEVSKDAVAKDAIQAVLEAAFPNHYNITESSYGAYLSPIDGLNMGENGDSTGEWGDCSGWSYMVNGQDAAVGISNYQLNNHDVIQLYYSCAGFGDNRTASNYEKISVTVKVQDTAARIEGTSPIVTEAKGILVEETTVELSKGANALEAIQTVLQTHLAGKYTLAASNYGAYITGIDGVNLGENGDSTGEWGDCSGWLYLVNGTQASVGIESTVLQNGDQIQLAYSCTGMGDDIQTAGEMPSETLTPTDTPKPTKMPDKMDDASLNPDVAEQARLLEKARTAQKLIADYVYGNLLSSGEYVPAFGEDGEYTVFTLARSNYPVKDGYFERYYEGLEASFRELNSTGKVCVSEERNQWLSMEDIAVSDWAKAAMVATALGKDASNVGGMNLIEKLVDISYLEGINEWLKYPTVLMAITTGEYTLPVGAEYFTKEELAKKVAESIPSAIASGYVDTVAMTLQPLAPFYDKDAVKGTAAYDLKEKIEEGIRFIAESQFETGYFNDWGTDNNPWSTTQVMILLGELGINPLNEDHGYDFIKNGKTVFDTMFEYIDFETGTLDSAFVAYDPVQFIRGFEACIRFLEGRVGLFACEDVKKPVGTNEPQSTNPPSDGSAREDNPEGQGQATSKPTAVKEGTSSAKTGDNAPIGLWIMVMACAAAAVGRLGMKKKRAV